MKRSAWIFIAIVIGAVIVAIAYALLSSGLAWPLVGSDTNQSFNNQKNMEEASITSENKAVEEPRPGQVSEQINFENITQAIIKTSLGDITVEFYKEDSPETVENFLKLTNDGFFDGIKFHRVIKDFMIQTGDPLSKDDRMQSIWGTGGPGYAFADEFNSRPLVRGSLAMANSGPNTNGSQFFIVTAESTPWLDGKHTNFGQVVAGLDVALAIESVATVGSDRPVDPVFIESIELQ
jgi:cyclophilin family peptidyl-prolyl cis-trans isomerase